MNDFASEIAARTIWAEARSEGEEGMRAVAHVLVNRLNDGRWGGNLASVCLAAFQFSSWNTNDPNRKALASLADDDVLLNAIRDFLTDALGGDNDPTKGSTHYYATTIPAPLWARSATLQAQIGHHLFYSNVP